MSCETVWWKGSCFSCKTIGLNEIKAKHNFILLWPPHLLMKRTSIHKVQWSSKTAHQQISWIVKTVRLDVRITVLHWNFAGTLTALLSILLVNFRTTRQLSWLWGLRDLGTVSIERCRLTSIVIPMLKTRRSRNRLIFNMGIPIPGKDGLYIEIGPC